MELRVVLSSGEELQASDVFLTRAFGQPVRWRFNVKMQQGHFGPEQQQLEDAMMRALSKGSCKATPKCVSGPASELGPAVTIVGANRPWGDGWDRPVWDNRDPQDLEIHANGTDGDPQRDPFLPRRRVHRVSNLNELIRRFEHVAQPIGALEAQLERVTFPDAGHSSIVQDDISDWDFLHHIFDQCRLLRPDEMRWLPLTMVGGVDGSTEGRWVITPGLRHAYEDWGAIEGATIHYDDSLRTDGRRRIEFGTLPNGHRVPEFATGETPCVIERRSQRTVGSGRWDNWRKMDLPRFTQDGAMIVRIEDRLYVSQDGLGWDSRTYAVPPEARVQAPERPGLRRPWTGLGKVTETSRKGPWIKVKLPGFEGGDNVVDVRISTPFSGKNGRRGVHMVPENGTEVLIAWTGRFDESIILVGNYRREEAEYTSPSTWLEDEFTAQYADVHVVKIGDTTIDSKLGVSVKKTTDIASQRPLQVKADGADLKMRGGIVYTGRAG